MISLVEKYEQIRANAVAQLATDDLSQYTRGILMGEKRMCLSIIADLQAVDVITDSADACVYSPRSGE